MWRIQLTCGSPFGRLLPSCISDLSFYRLYFGGYSIFMIARSIDPAPLPSENRSTMGPGSPSSAPPAPHRMLHEQRFFFLASKAIVFTLSCVYGRSLLTGYLTNVINPTRASVDQSGGRGSCGHLETESFSIPVDGTGPPLSPGRQFLMMMTTLQLSQCGADCERAHPRRQQKARRVPQPTAL